METVRIYRATKRDLELVNQFLIENFFSREPLGVRLGIDPENDTRAWISEVTLPLLSQGVSCLAHNEDRLVGICLNKIEHADPSQNIQSFAEAVEGKSVAFMNEILALMNELYSDLDLLTASKRDKMMVINMLCVSPEMAGRGLGSRMMEWSESMAKENAISLITAETTGVASGKLFQKAGFQKVKELSYDDYTNKEGKKPFFQLHPHRACVVWKKELLP